MASKNQKSITPQTVAQQILTSQPNTKIVLTADKTLKDVPASYVLSDEESFVAHY